MVLRPRANKFVALLILALFSTQSLAYAAVAAGPADAPLAATASDSPAEIPEVPLTDAAQVVLNPAGEPLTARQAIARLTDTPVPGAGAINAAREPLLEPPAFSPRAPAREPLAITPLADTDNNDPNDARWINSTDTQFIGENINGAAQGSPPRRTDIDWWRFQLGFTPASADTISFDITKDSWDHVTVVVWTWPDADPDGAPYVARYDYMNRTQGLGAPSSFSFTAPEDADYLMRIQTLFRRTGCCMVNYSITNIAFSSTPPADDNNNLTRSQVFSPTALPTDREVDQAHDLFDVYDLTSQFAMDPQRGDEAQVQLGVSVSAGRTGFTDWYNSTLGNADADTVVSVGIFSLLYRDPSNFWRALPVVALTPGNSGTIQGLINGTPIYAVVRVEAFGAGTGVTSSVPGWVRYNITGLSIQEDHSPVKTADIPSLSMQEDTPSSGVNIVDLSAYFTDDIDGGALWFTVIYTQFPFVQASINGTWLSVVVNQPEWSGTMNFRVAAHDLGWDRVAGVDDHVTPSNYFSVVVQAVNDAPQILTYGGQTVTGPSLSFTVAQDQTLVLSAIAADPEDSDSLTWWLTPALQNASLNVTTGQLTLNPTNGDVGNHTTVLSVRDPSAASASITLNIDITNVNDPPRFIDVGGQDPAGPLEFQALQGTEFTLVLKIEDPDFVIGVAQAFYYSSDQPFISFDANPSDPTEAIASFTPTSAQVGPLTVRFSVGDGPAGVFRDNVTVTITVANRNDPPVFTHVGTTTGVYALTSKTFSFLGLDGAIQGRDFVLTVRAADLDVAAGHGDALSFETNMPGKVLVSLNPDGLSADLSFVPDQADAMVGQIQVLVYVNDSLVPVLGDVLMIIIDITNVNDPPELTPVASLTLTQDEPFSYIFGSVDPDGDDVTFSSDSPLFPVDSTTGSIDFTPTNVDIGGADKVFEVTITARDSHGGVATMRVTVVIENVNDAPSGAEVLNPIAGTTFGIGEAITFAGNAVDIDKDDTATLAYTWYADGTLMGEGKTVTGSLTNEGTAPRVVEIRMQVTDVHGASVNQTLTITVEGKVEGGPGFEGPAALAGLAGAALAAALLARRRRRAE